MVDIVLIISTIIIIILQSIILSRVSSDRSVEIKRQIEYMEKNIDRLEKGLRDEVAKNREEIGNNLNTFRTSLQSSISDTVKIQQSLQDTTSRQINDLTLSNEQRLEKMREAVEIKLEKMRETVEARLERIQKDNNEQLERMRNTVDEKLQETLEKRLDNSFKLVSERLEQVHKGLGEMQTLASGVGDLKKVLTNVKTRGTWGEIQLGNLLEQVLTPEQYSSNVATKKGSSDRVEFAIRMPGKDGNSDSLVWLPIDAKFPMEDYQKLINAQEEGNPALADEAGKHLETRIKLCAKDIRDKYIDPPNTTDFAIMFLPTEGLYAEILRRPGLFELLQRDFRVVVTGPTTLAALLNSLQMGFRTLAIEKRSSEVWALLGAVKTEFGKFGEVLEKTKKKLQEASNTIDSASTRTRAIERKLRDVQELPSSESANLLDEL